MTINDLIKELSLDIRSCENGIKNSVTGCYVSDLLSDVMVNSREGNIWITLQIHPNIVAVANMKDLAGIIVVGNRQPQMDTLQKAETENILIATTPLPAFETAGKIYQLLS